MNKQAIKDWLQPITTRLVTIWRIFTARNFVVATGSTKTGTCDIAFCLDDDDTTALRFLDWSEYRLNHELNRVGLTHPSYTYHEDLNRQLLAHIKDKVNLQDEINYLRDYNDRLKAKIETQLKKPAHPQPDPSQAAQQTPQPDPSQAAQQTPQPDPSQAAQQFPSGLCPRRDSGNDTADTATAGTATDTTATPTVPSAGARGQAQQGPDTASGPSAAPAAPLKPKPNKKPAAKKKAAGNK